MNEHAAQIFTLVIVVFLSTLLVQHLSLAQPVECTEGLCDEKDQAFEPVKEDSAEGFVDDVNSDSVEKRLHKFVRIGKALGSSFVRIGRPNSFVRIGKSTDGGDFDTELEEPDKRQSRFLRIGKAMNKFLRIGKSGENDKRQSRFLRIGRDGLDESNMSKRGHAFIRIGKIPSSAFVRIGRDPLYDEIMKKPSSSFLRIGRMGQSSFVRIGKRNTDDATSDTGSQYSV